MFAVIYIPNFSLQAVLRHEPQAYAQLVALVDPEATKPVIIQTGPIARQWGVQEGLTASQAMARCSGLVIKRRSAAQEQSVTDVLLQAAYAFSPLIESTAPGICTVGLTGLGLDDETAMLSWSLKLFQMLTGLGLDARIGMAKTPALALLAARGATPVSFVGNPEEFVGTLPLEALEPSPEILEILTRWGIRTVGAFLTLGKDEIGERLGAAGLELFERVSTEATRPLKQVAPPEHFTEQIEFENEIETMEPLLFILRRFVEQLARRLGALYFVVAELKLELGLASGAKRERTFKIPAPTGNPEILFRMLHTHLETVRTDSAIISLQLQAAPSAPETHQFGLFETTLRNPNQFADTLARLTALCGPDRVGTPVLEATHRPDMFKLQTPDFNRSASATGPTPAQGLQLRRFRPPLTAVIEFRGARPALIRSPVFTGAITDVRGPFRSSGDWWDQQRWRREEWDVQTTDGALYRIFQSDGGSYVEGVYD